MFKMIMGQYGDESDEEPYLPDEFINQCVDDDEMTPGEAWFLQGWREAY